MSLPNEPVTRGEQYLNAIATGDNSGIPAEPVTREEMYLDYIAKNGGGGGTTVVANPTLAGTEADLTGLQVGDTKYKVTAGGGGGGVTICPLTVVVDGSSFVYTATMTASDLWTAAQAGVVVFTWRQYTDDPNLPLDHSFSYPCRAEYNLYRGEETYIFVAGNVLVLTAENGTDYPTQGGGPK